MARVRAGSDAGPCTETNEFWLNLHHFLYVLGRAESKAEDASLEAVAGAPPEAERGLKNLTAAEQRAWADAVTAYSGGLSQLDAIRGTPMPDITAALAQADDAPTLDGISIDSRARERLERAAPLYRNAWWPAQRASNQAWRTSIEKLVAQHGRTILDFITRAYGLQWPDAGFPVHASRYSNWAGGYSSLRGVLVRLSLMRGVHRRQGGLVNTDRSRRGERRPRPVFQTNTADSAATNTAITVVRMM